MTTDTGPASGREQTPRRRGRLAYAISLLMAVVAGAAIVAVFAVLRARGSQPTRPSGIPPASPTARST